MNRKVEIFDLLQHLYQTTGFSDHQLHGILELDGKIDSNVLKKSVLLLIQTIPILSSVYVDKGGESYWRYQDTFPESFYFTHALTQKEFEDFTFSSVDEVRGPQIKICCLATQKSTISVVLSHMVTDGAGLKQCLYLLSEFYSNLHRNPNFTPGYRIDGDRSFSPILSELSLPKKTKTLLFQNKENNQSCPYEFFMSNNKKIAPFILVHTLKKETYEKILTLSKTAQVTINDILLTAYFRVLTDILKKRGKALRIPIMIDMRKYAKEYHFNALTNLSSTEVISTFVEEEETFAQTLDKIHTILRKKKKRLLGMNAFLKLSAAFQILPAKSAYELLKETLSNPKICMTNIGVVESQKLSFMGLKVRNVITTGSIKYRPHFQLAVNSFEDKMNLSVNLYGSLEDQTLIKDFLAQMETELFLATAEHSLSMPLQQKDPIPL